MYIQHILLVLFVIIVAVFMALALRPRSMRQKLIQAEDDVANTTERFQYWSRVTASAPGQPTQYDENMLIHAMTQMQEAQNRLHYLVSRLY